MTQSTAKQLSTEKLLLAVGIVAIAAGAAVGVSVGYAVHYEAPTTRAFYLFNNSLPFDQHTWGIPHDTFSPDRITVNKGDKVVIYYRNIEDTTEAHTFTMDAPYTFDAIVHAGFFENLWYVMGSIYIFTGAVIAANFEPRFTQPAVFGYAIFLFALWATTALGTGAGLDTVAYVDKAIEALLVVNMALLIRSSRNPSALS